MTNEEFFSIQISLTESLEHPPTGDCSFCAYGHIMASTAKQMLERPDIKELPGTTAIKIWAEEVDRIARERGIAPRLPDDFFRRLTDEPSAEGPPLDG